jgi:hypothetical protein
MLRASALGICTGHVDVKLLGDYDCSHTMNIHNHVDKTYKIMQTGCNDFTVHRLLGVSIALRLTEQIKIL